VSKKFTIFHVDGGVGKNIVATSVVRAIKKNYPDRELVVVSHYPEIFIHNPNIYRVYKLGMCSYFYEDYIRNKNSLILRQEPYYSSDVINRNKNLSHAWCDSLNINFDSEKPELFFNVIEEQNADLLFKNINNNKPVIAVQTNGGSGYENNNITFNWYRDVPISLIQPVIDKYKDVFTFVQIRSENQPVLENTSQVKLTIREILLLLSKTSGSISIDSFTQHALASFNKPSVVLWVGTSEKVFGYSKNKNIISSYRSELDNLESYLEPYPLITKGHQCPKNYNPYNLFDPNIIDQNFKELYLS